MLSLSVSFRDSDPRGECAPGPGLDVEHAQSDVPGERHQLEPHHQEVPEPEGGAQNGRTERWVPSTGRVIMIKIRHFFPVLKTLSLRVLVS